MNDPIFEQEADLAFHRTVEIDAAAIWCKSNYPHKFEFLNEIYRALVSEERHMAKIGLADAFRLGDVKPQPVLSLLSPSQALRMLECHKRVLLNTPAAWKARSLKALDRIESDLKLANARNEFATKKR